MSGELLNSVSNALSQVFDRELYKQWNRTAVTAALVGAKAGRGKNAAWDVEFTGATAGTVAEGSDVQDSEFNSDINVPAVLSWAHYRSSFKVSETEIDAAISSMGTADALMEIFEDRITGSVNKIAEAIDVDIISGTGIDGNNQPTIVGILGGALEASGLYAGINRSTYSEWQGNVLSNGGNPRPLSADLLYQMEQSIFTASGRVPDCIVTSPGVYRKYAGLFESVRRLATDGMGPLAYKMGAAELFWKGIPVVRDRKFTAGTLAMLCSDTIETKYLPRHLPPQDAVQMSMKQLEGSNGDKVMTMTQVPGRVALLAKTGDSVKASVKVTLALCVKRPNANGYISDLSES